MQETMVDAKVPYTLKHLGKLYFIEHVLARICRQAREEYFAPETAEHIHGLIKGGKKPDRVIETPVVEYAYVCGTGGKENDAEQHHQAV